MGGKALGGGLGGCWSVGCWCWVLGVGSGVGWFGLLVWVVGVLGGWAGWVLGVGLGVCWGVGSRVVGICTLCKVFSLFHFFRVFFLHFFLGVWFLSFWIFHFFSKKVYFFFLKKFVFRLFLCVWSQLCILFSFSIRFFSWKLSVLLETIYSRLKPKFQKKLPRPEIWIFSCLNVRNHFYFQNRFQDLRMISIVFKKISKVSKSFFF